MTTPSTPITSDAPYTPASPRSQLLDVFRRESATTMRVLRAFPAEQAELRPHPDARSARELAFTFAIEQALLAQALTDQLRLPPALPAMPAAWAEVLERVEASFQDTIALLEGLADEQLHGTTTFLVAPRTPGAVPKLQLAWLMLLDQVHHRGQLSVYLRMAGGKVPSIYGGSRDEPWF